MGKEGWKIFLLIAGFFLVLGVLPAVFVGSDDRSVMFSGFMGSERCPDNPPVEISEEASMSSSFEIGEGEPCSDIGLDDRLEVLIFKEAVRAKAFADCYFEMAKVLERANCPEGCHKVFSTDMECYLSYIRCDPDGGWGPICSFTCEAETAGTAHIKCEPGGGMAVPTSRPATEYELDEKVYPCEEARISSLGGCDGFTGMHKLCCEKKAQIEDLKCKKDEGLLFGGDIAYAEEAEIWFSENCGEYYSAFPDDHFGK